MAKNLPNLGKKTDIQIQEAQRVPKNMNPKRPTPEHIIIKLAELKTKRESLKQQKKNNLFHTKNFHKTISHFSQKLCRPEWSGLTYSKC